VNIHHKPVKDVQDIMHGQINIKKTCTKVINTTQSNSMSQSKRINLQLELLAVMIASTVFFRIYQIS